VEKKLKANRMTNTINRIHVAMPTPRDDKERAPVLPPDSKQSKMDDEEKEESTKEESTLERMQRLFEERLQMEQKENEIWARGEVPGMNSKLWQERYLLKNPDWRFDNIPEIIDGQNIADFVDTEIEQMLEELEKEEEERLTKLEEEKANRPEELELDDEEVKILNLIRKKKLIMKKQHDLDVSSHPATRAIKNREQTFDDLESHLKGRGFDKEQASETVTNIRDFARSRSRSASRMGRKRERSEIKEIAEGGMTELEKKKARREEKSRSRLRSLTPTPGSGMKDLKDVLKAGKIAKASIRDRSRLGKKGESDRVILTNMPKHLFAGKRGVGKTQRR